MSTLDEVIETVRGARADGPDALAAMALSYGATMALGVVRNRSMRGQIAEMRAALEATEATAATLRTERDAARDEAKAARQRMEEVREQCDRARDDAEMFARQRDEARTSMLAQDLARDEVWKLRESVEALRARAERAEAERDAAVQEREAFSLRASAAEHARDENRNAWAEACRERDALRARPTYEARATAPTRQELRLHREQHGGWWIVTRAGDRPTVLRLGADDADDAGASPATPRTWLPLDASGLPCAWPVVP